MPSSNQFVTFNLFKPLDATRAPSGRSAQQNLTVVNGTRASGANFSTLLRNRAYARLDEGTITRANPSFDTGAAGRILNSISEQGNQRDPRIVRGYIRRTVIDGSDPTSSYRLYFMYNPAAIRRQYVEYLNQGALDPFNTVFGSNNLVAPPGILDFDFDLFFDRQVENASGTMPRGVLEDFDFFDLVVRGVVPDPQTPDMPDNGVLMVNPRNITVVFSPQISVQGRPNSAQVVYEKFDHTMRPIRMTIRMGMKVVYIGPVRQDFTFAQAREQGVVKATVPYENSAPVEVTVEKVTFAKLAALKKAEDNDDASIGGGYIGETNGQQRESALAAAEQKFGEYGASYGVHRPVTEDPSEIDCSGLIYWGYRKAGALDAIGSQSSSGSIMTACQGLGTEFGAGPLFRTDDFFRKLRRGDLLTNPGAGSSGHICFVAHNDLVAGELHTYESGGYGKCWGNGPHHAKAEYSFFYQPGRFSSALRPGAAGTNTTGNSDDPLDQGLYI